MDMSEEALAYEGSSDEDYIPVEPSTQESEIEEWLFWQYEGDDWTQIILDEEEYTRYNAGEARMRNLEKLAPPIQILTSSPRMSMMTKIRIFPTSLMTIVEAVGHIEKWKTL